MFDKFKVRCSAIREVMSNSRSNPSLTEKQRKRLDELQAKDNITENQVLELAELQAKEENSKKLILSDTCIEYLMEWYAMFTAQKQCVTKELDIQYTFKGKLVEEDSILLLSKLDKVLYLKNEERIENDFLTGEPDIHDGDHVKACKKIIDIKSVWDYPGFLKKINQKPDSGYDYQLKGYMDLSGAREAEIAYCLVNTPEIIVNDYRRRLFYKMNVPTQENPEYLRQCALLEHSMYFDDIPIEKRVFKVPIEPFSEEQRQAVYDRVKQCREWLEIFHEQYEKINK